MVLQAMIGLKAGCWWVTWMVILMMVISNSYGKFWILNLFQISFGKKIFTLSILVGLSINSETKTKTGKIDLRDGCMQNSAFLPVKYYFILVSPFVWFYAGFWLNWKKIRSLHRKVSHRNDVSKLCFQVNYHQKCFSQNESFQSQNRVCF